MTKIQLFLLSIGLPIIALVVIGAGFFIQKNSGTVFAGPNIISPTPFNTNVAVGGPTALLTKESGEVSYKLPNSEQFTVLETEEINLPSQTTIKTGTDSLAHVVFPDNSLMSLSKDTEVVLNFEEKKIKIFQILGNTWHRVEKVLEGHEYSVETPTTLATVRGTEFNVGNDANGAEVYVMESVVDVSKITKVGEEKQMSEPEKVTKDKHVFLKNTDVDKPIQVVDLPANKKQTDWFQRNSKLTEQIKKAEIEEEKKEGIETVTGTVTPPSEEVEEKKDIIRQRIRKEMMQTIKENVELKQIDAKFPTATDSGTRGAEGKVQGITTEKKIIPQDSTSIKKDVESKQEEKRSENTEKKDKTLQIDRPILNDVKVPEVVKPEEKKNEPQDPPKLNIDKVEKKEEKIERKDLQMNDRIIDRIR